MKQDRHVLGNQYLNPLPSRLQTQIPSERKWEHVHLLVHYPPKVAISKLINEWRGFTAREIPGRREDTWGKKQEAAMTEATATQLIQVGHSPDPDDAFMFYALAHKKIDTGRFRFQHVLRDIETLNRWAEEGKLEITALSVHAYAYVHDKYILLPHGASVGDKYGPILVGRPGATLEGLKQGKVAIPGRRTTAFLALSLAAPGLQVEEVAFDQIPDEVLAGRYDAGLLIHEGQLTYQRQGLAKILDLGEWWHDETGLPLPLGVNGVRRDLGADNIAELSRLLHQSIRYGLEHRQEALHYAIEFGRGLEADLADRFVGMYVNDHTLAIGPQVRQAVAELLRRGHAAGILPQVVEPDWAD